MDNAFLPLQFILYFLATVSVPTTKINKHASTLIIVKNEQDELTHLFTTCSYVLCN
jgi:hypothetical protein